MVTNRYKTKTEVDSLVTDIETLKSERKYKLNKIEALASDASVATVVTAFNSLIADLKTKGYMTS